MRARRTPDCFDERIRPDKIAQHSTSGREFYPAGSCRRQPDGRAVEEVRLRRLILRLNPLLDSQFLLVRFQELNNCSGAHGGYT